MVSAAAATENENDATSVVYQTDPTQYRHWKLEFDGALAILSMDVTETAGIRSGYTLKLNSYDLGVDIELHDALQRIRFEHPEVRTVILTSAKDRIFCSGANIFMLAGSDHPWKVNFCKFTNETRNGLEDSSKYSGLKFLAAVNGACAGGGYELAMACDEIVLVDDRSSAVSLPEVPLLGVLPGTGGLTRLTDKRRVRHDLADIFCTTAEGVRGQRALEWGLVDHIVKPARFSDAVRARALELAEQSDRDGEAQGVELVPLETRHSRDGLSYQYVKVDFDRVNHVANFLVQAPVGNHAGSIDDIVAAGARWWPLQMARELDDAILSMRTNELELGTWVFRTSGSTASVLACDEALDTHRNHWFVREVIGMLRRTLGRLDVTSRTIFALIESGSCFSGTLFEIALAADRSYMQASDGTGSDLPGVTLTSMNFGDYPLVSDQTRLSRRFYDAQKHLDRLKSLTGIELDVRQASELELITETPDDIDWEDEIRLAIEERASLSPDALTGLEANLRFGPRESMASRIFGRLSAWQNWIFIRPNAVGKGGALRSYGTGNRPVFDKKRV